MSENMNRLEHLSSLTQKWLIYAEAKNTALIVGNMLALYRIIDSIGSSQNQSLIQYVWVASLTLAVLMAFISIFPIRDYLELINRKDSDCTLNPLSSSNLIKHSPESLLKHLDIPVGPYEKEFAEHVLGTAALVLRKYLFFKLSCFFTLLSILIFAGMKLLNV